MNKTTSLKNIALIVLLITMFSCKQNSAEIKTEELITTTDSTETFEYKLKNEPKFFLKFWENMTEEEYHKVINVLQTDGKINGFGKYIVGQESVKIEPIKNNKNDKIIGIALYDFQENFYNLLRDKYELQPLVTENLYFDSYIEENPCYLETNCQDRLKRGKFIEKLDKKELNGLINMFDQKVLKKEYTEIKTTTSNIIISHNKSNKYDLDLEVSHYDSEYTLFLKLENNDERKRIVVRFNRDIKYAEYYSANYFEKREKEKKDDIIKTRKDDEKMKTKINQVKNAL